jgi:hypothetical protein
VGCVLSRVVGWAVDGEAVGGDVCIVGRLVSCNVATNVGIHVGRDVDVGFCVGLVTIVIMGAVKTAPETSR